MDDGGRRRAANEARFRDANRRIREKAIELEVDEPVPFLCECEDAACREILLLSVRDFGEICGRPAHFAVTPGHEGEGEHVVGRRDRAVVVEKVGAARREVETDG